MSQLQDFPTLAPQRWEMGGGFPFHLFFRLEKLENKKKLQWV
jgi:hypothetical protein